MLENIEELSQFAAGVIRISIMITATIIRSGVILNNEEVEELTKIVIAEMSSEHDEDELNIQEMIEFYLNEKRR